MISKIKEKRINLVLASSSPRRKELLEKMGFSFTLERVDIDEVITSKDPDVAVREIAVHKAEACRSRLRAEDLLITADTLVYASGQFLGKPKNHKEAKEMIQCLSGSIHEVYTEVAICYKGEIHSFAEKTQVEFYELEESDIAYYLTHYAYLDKAGSYGIQDWIGLIGVKRINGSFENVMGLPTSRLYKELRRILEE